MGDLLGIDLVKNPEDALLPEVAAKVMIIGMKDGLFTGHKLTEYVGNGKHDYINARKVVNGLDKVE